MEGRLFIESILLLISFSSCSVKEDRAPCPCQLDIHIGGSGAYVGRLSLSGWDDVSGRLFLDRLETADYPDIYSRKVDKGYINVCAFGGNEAMTLKGNILTIPEGSQGEAIWAYCGATLDVTGETAEEIVLLHKQYADVFIKADQQSMALGDLTLRAVGNVNGMDIRNLVPSQGRFHCFSVLDGDLNHCFRLPRQADTSLELEVYVDGALERTFSLGKMISASGYSWTKQDLDDIFVSISLSQQPVISISVNSWDSENHVYTF